jgi:hypothetical protein
MQSLPAYYIRDCKKTDSKKLSLKEKIAIYKKVNGKSVARLNYNA